MTTNEEKREVAKKLRAYNASYSPLWYRIAEAFEVPTTMTFREFLDMVADLIDTEPVNGDTSDGYHTFNELYDHRAKLFSVIVSAFPERSWKSKLHHDGTMYEGMFIVGIDTPEGQASYHYDIDPYWRLFNCKVIDSAPEWDGHTPKQAIERISNLSLIINKNREKNYDRRWHKTISDEERCEIAENLRTMCAYGCKYREQFYDLLNETIMDDWDFHEFNDVADRLADLIKPNYLCNREALLQVSDYLESFADDAMKLRHWVNPEILIQASEDIRKYCGVKVLEK